MFSMIGKTTKRTIDFKINKNILMNQARYLDYNGEFYRNTEAIFQAGNRSFKYGDGIFETMRCDNGKIPLLNYHIQRLQESMELLQFDRPHKFGDDLILSRVEALLRKNDLLENECRVRLAVFRDGDGLYTPTTNATAYLLEVSRLDKKVNIHNQAGLIVDVFPDHRKPINTLSGLKTSNALLYVLAANYRKKHGLDDVVILNQDGFICESSSSNIFVIYQNTIYTPALTEGCVRGVMRRSIIDFAQETGIEIIEAQISPHILNEAEEIFLTNAVHGMQCVLGYKKKRYFNRLSKVFWGQYEQWLYKPSVD